MKKIAYPIALMFLGLGLCTANALAGLQSAKITEKNVTVAPDPSPQLVANTLNDISTDVPTALAGLSNTVIDDATFTAGTDQATTALAQNTTDQGSLALTGNNKTRTGQLTLYAAVGLAKDTNTVATLGIPIASPGS